MPVQIRAIEASDEAVWKGLWAQYNVFYNRTIPAEVTQTTFSRFLDPNTRIYCALAVSTEEAATSGSASDSAAAIPQSTPIGFVTWYPHPSTSSIQEVVYLHDLFVDPSVRNKGAGRALIEHVYEQAKLISVDAVYWHTQYFNHVAQILYNKVATRTDFVMYQKTS